MSVTKLFRVVVRQRVNFTPGTDLSAPEQIKPPEIEGASIERDITAYVQGYKLPKSRENMSSECTIGFISPV